jgi:predicted RNase H-like HicB family nuclease
MVFKVIITRDDDGRFNATCPELRGCNSFGDTVEDAMNNIREAIELYIEDLTDDQIKDIRYPVEIMDIAV